LKVSRFANLRFDVNVGDTSDGKVEKWRRSGEKEMQMKHVGSAVKAWISDAYLLDTRM